MADYFLKIKKKKNWNLQNYKFVFNIYFGSHISIDQIINSINLYKLKIIQNTNIEPMLF